MVFSEPTLPPELRAFSEKFEAHNFSDNVAWILNTPVLIPENAFTNVKRVAPPKLPFEINNLAP